MCDYDDFDDGIDWDDWLIIGPLSEDIAREKREKEDLERNSDISEDYWETFAINRNDEKPICGK